MSEKTNYALHNLDTVRAVDLKQIHRDLAAHESRWSFVDRWVAGEYRLMALRYTHFAKFFGSKAHMEGTLVDLGCGPVIAMARMLYTNRRKVKKYVGVDYRKVEPFKTHFPLVTFAGDVTTPPVYEEVLTELGQRPPDYIVSFEVIEHMDKEHGLAFLDRIRELAGIHTTIFLSTPCHDGVHMPAEHIYEWRWAELKEELEKRFAIEMNFGTFASQKEILPVMDEHELRVFYRLADYYDSHYLATIFAPMHPAESRNSLWILRKVE